MVLQCLPYLKEFLVANSIKSSVGEKAWLRNTDIYAPHCTSFWPKLGSAVRESGHGRGGSEGEWDLVEGQPSTPGRASDLRQAWSCSATARALFVWAFTGGFLLSSVSSFKGPEKRQKALETNCSSGFQFQRMFSPASNRPYTQLCWIPSQSVGQPSAPYCPMTSSGEGGVCSAGCFPPGLLSCTLPLCFQCECVIVGFLFFLVGRGGGNASFFPQAKKPVFSSFSNTWWKSKVGLEGEAQYNLILSGNQRSLWTSVQG